MKNPDAAKSWRARTRAVRGATRRTPFQETSEGLFLTSGYAYDSAEQAWARFKGEDPGFQYSRFGNPTVSMFEERMCLLEGAEAARATASGMAAVTASLLCFLRAGDHVVSARALFGSCRYVVEEVLSRLGIASTLIDGRDLAAWRAAVRPNTRAFFLETPSNPTLEIIDLKGVAQIAREVKARLVVDNVFASPILQRPMESGADIVVYSATKHIDGQGRCLGGVILCDEAFIRDHLQMFVRNTGPTLSPFNAWVLLKSLETLELRMGEHCRNAAAIADFLAEQKKVTRVLDPGRRDHPQHGLAMKQMSQGGSMVTFEIAGGRTEAFRFANALRIIDISNNLGDAKSLVTHPATTTHWRIGADARAELGISDAMLRLSVGLEDVEDLKEDLTQALAAI
jgi:O-succinylhomoserine sulfhydrylase